jgi:hypothetical protein
MNQDTLTKFFFQKAIDAGFYNSVDIQKFQNYLVNEIILDNLPVGTPLPNFNSYLDKINYIISCKYNVKGY